MPLYDIQIEIARESGAAVAPEQVGLLVEAALVAESVQPGTAVWLRISTDEELAELNAVHRGQEGPTDVLSFPTQGQDGWITPPGAPVELGDIVISWPRIVAQAAEQGHPAWHELALIVVHGCLHLLGHDHMLASERSLMWERQEQILGQLGIVVRLD